MPGKRLQFDDETWQAIEAVASQSARSFQELADEAFADLYCIARLGDFGPVPFFRHQGGKSTK